MESQINKPQFPTEGVVLVTGGGTGIGFAIARELAVQGWQVVITGRRQDVLKIASGNIDGTVPVAFFPSDLTKPEEVEALFSYIQNRFGRLDLLVNNAGTNAKSSGIEDISLADWNSVIAANLTAVFQCSQYAIRQFKRQRPIGGRIINNGSIAAQRPRPNSAAYAASKSAISGLTQVTALEGREFNIACGQIDIGNASTNMTSEFSQGVPQPDGCSIPEPTIDAENVAKAVLYMAGLPLDANVLQMTIMATKMPFLGRG